MPVDLSATRRSPPLPALIWLLLPAILGTWAWFASEELVHAVGGAVRTEGVVERIERLREGRERGGVLTGFVVHVRFTGPDGVERVRPVQHGGTSPEDTEFDSYTADITDFLPEGEKAVSLLYHPELGHLVWIDDFYTLWAYPLFLCAVTLVSGIVVGIGLWSAFLRRRSGDGDEATAGSTGGP